jgi:hypothetical protein
MSHERDHDRIPSRLTGETAREAVDSFGGYLYQGWQSLVAWLELTDDSDVLFLEGAEDIEKLRRSGADVIQVKREAGNVTLKSRKVLESIGHFWGHVARNPDRAIRFSYLTTADIGLEKGNPYGLNRPGLVLWEEARSIDDPALWVPIVSAIASALSNEEALPVVLRTFLAAAGPQEIRERLFIPFAFDVSAAQPADLRHRAERALARYGLGKGFNTAQSLQALSRLFDRVLEAAVARTDRFLDLLELRITFEQATSVPIPINSALFASGMRTPHVPQEQPVLDEMPPMPPRYWRRPTLFEPIAARVDAHGLAFLVGSSGTGKTGSALDYARSVGGDWRRVDLRNRNADESERVLRVAVRQAQQSAEAYSLLVDDLDMSGDAARLGRALKMLIDEVRGVGARVIITSFLPPPPSVQTATETNNDFVVNMENFSELEVAAFLESQAAPADRAAKWGRIIFATTAGHPTLVAARAASLIASAFPEPTVDDIFEAPREVGDVMSEARRFIASLNAPDRELLYRLSLVTMTNPRREHVVALAATEVPPEGAIAAAGTVFDRLVGPWIEALGSERYSASPLISRAGEYAYDPQWVKRTHSAIARSLLVRDPVDIRDAVAAILHALWGEDASTVEGLLMSFVQRVDEDFWLALSRTNRWFAAIGIDVPPIAGLQNTAALWLLRCAQYRVARVANAADQARKIVAAFEMEAGSMADSPFRLMMLYSFYGNVVIYPAEPVPAMMDHAFRWIEVDAQLHREQPDISGLVEDMLVNSADACGDVAYWAGTNIFSGVATQSDLESVAEKLRPQDPDVARRFLGFVSVHSMIWRGVAAGLVANEHAADEPDFASLGRSLERFAVFVSSLGLDSFALECYTSTARVLAEFADDPTSATAVVDNAEAIYGRRARLTLARASIAHATADWQSSFDLFREAQAALDYEADDPEPALDMRLAANDAGNLRRFDDAAALLESAANMLKSSPAAPLMPCALKFDASYAAWRAGDSHRALSLATSAASEALGLEHVAEKEAVSDLARRVGTVFMEITARDRALERNQDGGLFAVGFLSNPDPLPPMDNPPGLDIALMALSQFELQVGDRPEILDAHADRLMANPLPVGALVRHISITWAIRLGRTGELIETIAGIERDRRDMEALGRYDAGPLPTVELVAAVLVRLCADGAPDRAIIDDIQRDAHEFGVVDVAGWLALVIDLMDDRELMLKMLRGSGNITNRERLAAGVAHGLLGGGTPDTILLAEQAWVAFLGLHDPLYPTLSSIRETVANQWTTVVSKQRVALVAPRHTVPALESAIADRSGNVRTQILRIFRAAARAADSTVHPPISEFLERT